jgi:hypothetical protein
VHPVFKYDDPIEKKQFIIKVNLKRSHLDEFQKAELGILLEGIEGERTKKKDNQKRKTIPTQNRI